MESDDGSSMASIRSIKLPVFDDDNIAAKIDRPGDAAKNRKMKANNRVKGKARGKTEESYEMFSKGYKTVPCEFFLKGHCQKGDDCKFRHDVEQKPLDLICKFYLAGSCNNKRCLYLHDTSKYPCKFLYVSGKCDKMTECIFSHARFASTAQINDFVKQNLESLRVHRDKGITSAVLKYAIEKGHLKETAELERQEKMGLIPPGLYEDSDPEDDETQGGNGGQIGGGTRSREATGQSRTEVRQSRDEASDLFMP